MMSIAWWLLENWLLVLLVVALVVVRIVFGWRAVFILGTAGLGALLYRKGRKDERDHYAEYVKDISERRQEAYDEIDNRGTDRNDVADRLRKGDY